MAPAYSGRRPGRWKGSGRERVDMRIALNALPCRMRIAGSIRREDRVKATLAGLFLAGILTLLPAISGGAPGDGIAGTAHDFSIRGGRVDLCISCHTPHRVTSKVLLWNETLSTDTFSWERSSTVVRTSSLMQGGDVYYGPTAKCLSCHDGSVAVGQLVRRGGGTTGGPLGEMERARFGGPNLDGPSGISGAMTDIHPVATPYPFGGRSIYNGVSNGDQLIPSQWQADPRRLNIRLYTEGRGGLVVAGADGLRTGIECSSCHDPHNKSSMEAKFLRGKLMGTGTEHLCTKCHNN